MQCCSCGTCPARWCISTLWRRQPVGPQLLQDVPLGVDLAMRNSQRRLGVQQHVSMCATFGRRTCKPGASGTLPRHTFCLCPAMAPPMGRGGGAAGVPGRPPPPGWQRLGLAQRATAPPPGGSGRAEPGGQRSVHDGWPQYKHSRVLMGRPECCPSRRHVVAHLSVARHKVMRLHV